MTCECPCHTKGTPGVGYSFIWDDYLEIRHEDWITCKCVAADPDVCLTEVTCLCSRRPPFWEVVRDPECPIHREPIYE